jgi:hypothetical protein
MTMLNVAAGLFALYMLVRHVPALLRALREWRAGRRELSRVLVPAVNVALAVLIVALAVMFFAGGAAWLRPLAR